jgi:thiol-disulfide isomerase/thioredoxin
MIRIEVSVCKFSLASVLVALMIYGLGSAAIAANISSIKVDKVPEIISGERGRPAVVILFSSSCPLSRNFWPQFLEFNKNNRGKNISFLGFSTDRDLNNATDFVSGSDVSFPCYWVEPYVRGTLAASIRSLGIQVGNTFTLPLVLVQDSNGHIIGAWQGLQEISPVVNALKAMGAI